VRAGAGLSHELRWAHKKKKEKRKTSCERRGRQQRRVPKSEAGLGAQQMPKAVAGWTPAPAECGGAPARKLAGAYLPFPHPSFCLAVSRRSSLVVMGGNDGDGDHGAQDHGKHLGAQHTARRRPYVANTRTAPSTPSPTAGAAPCSILRALRRREDYHHHHHHHHRRRAVLVAGLARPSQAHL
jgi:hypothetical protein